MTVHNIGISTRIADIKAALQAKGKLTTLYFEDASNLIVLTPYTTKVIRFASTGAIFVGDAWTSGTTITNSKAVNPIQTAFDTASKLTLTEKVLCFSGYGVNTSFAIFGKTKTDGKEFFLGGHTSSTQSATIGTSQCDGVPTKPANDFRGLPVLDASNFYYMTDLYLTNASGVLFANPADGLKLIAKTMAITDAEVLSDNGVAIPCVNVGWNGTSTSYQAAFYIENGAV